MHFTSLADPSTRGLTRFKMCDHITSVVFARDDFKILLLTYKNLYGLAPSYISSLFTYNSYTPSHPLLPLHAFAFFGTIREARYLDTFESRLKTNFKLIFTLETSCLNPVFIEAFLPLCLGNR